MHPDNPSIREFLAGALRGEDQCWPSAWSSEGALQDVSRAATFHGVQGLLVDHPNSIRSWPGQLVQELKEQARALAMWELRHRQLLSAVIAELADHSIHCLIMKGSAVAYDVYSNPSTRCRSDTDLLVFPADAAKAKAILAKAGYSAGVLGGVTPEFSLQEVWARTLEGGNSHVIDLHWQVINAPSLRNLLPVSECFAHSRPLPGLSSQAITMDRVRLLIHTCVHRAMQRNAPYCVDGHSYFEPRRLIWECDIQLLAAALTNEEWSQFCGLAGSKGVAGTCLEALQAATKTFGTQIPSLAEQSLRLATSKDRKSAYLVRSHAAARAWQDIGAIQGLTTKLRYVLSRVVTTEPFLRAKYPQMSDRPLAHLYVKRLIDLFRGKVRKAAG
jgi:hypothetical protein